MPGIVQVEISERIATITLNDPDRRNALGFAMFEGLDSALRNVAGRSGVSVALLRGSGKDFCAGFDLAAARAHGAVIGAFIERLSALLRAVRRLPQVVVAAVQGSAIAGGCALVSAADVVVASAQAKLGYPVHRLGVSPAVTLPTLLAAIGSGPARSLLLEGRLIDGAAALRLGLAHRLSRDDAAVGADAAALSAVIAAHGPHALRATKAWLNELEGADDDRRFDAPARDSAALAATAEAQAALRAFLDR